jgi:hypothetical protein
MADTTSIMDLPTDPAGGGASNQSISFTASEKDNLGVSLDQNTINQIVNGLQQASASGITQLASRDIPLTTQNMTNDVEIQPNYIPYPSKENQVDYIKEYEDNNEIIDNYNKNAKYKDSLDKIYDEIQVPLLMSVLYFLFQLPIIKKYLYHYFPALFLKDGNANLYGLIFISVLFGLLYYILSKMIIQFNVF